MDYDSLMVTRIEGRSLWKDVANRFRRNRLAFWSFITLSMMTLCALIVPLIHPHDYEQIFFRFVQSPPNWTEGFYLGTDVNGRDLLVRLMIGARVSLVIGLVASLISLAIGVFYGAVSGYIGGRFDRLAMAIVDTFYSLPFIFIVICINFYLESGIFAVFVSIVMVEWLDMARLARSQAMMLKNKEFVHVAQIMGVPLFKIILRHIVPNALGPILVFLTLMIPRVILLESSLSFLGLGIQEPMTSLGLLISDGADQMQAAWWSLIFPGLFLSLGLLLFNFIGEGLRRALDPREQ